MNAEITGWRCTYRGAIYRLYRPQVHEENRSDTGKSCQHWYRDSHVRKGISFCLDTGKSQCVLSTWTTICNYQKSSEPQSTQQWLVHDSELHYQSKAFILLKFPCIRITQNAKIYRCYLDTLEPKLTVYSHEWCSVVRRSWTSCIRNFSKHPSPVHQASPAT